MKATKNTESRHGPLYDNPRRPTKNPGLEHKVNYKTKVMFGFVVSLSLLTAVFRMDIRPSEDGLDITMTVQETVQMEEIVQTEQEIKAPPPPRPPVPVAVPDDYVFDEVELDLDAMLDLDEVITDLPPPPPTPVTDDEPEEEEMEIFVVVEEMPSIIGGSQEVYKYLEYPEIARKAGLEGLVVIQVVVTPEGKPSMPEVARSAGQVLDEAAVRAVMQLSFEPGMQRGRAVRVRMAIPIRFRLRDAQ
ncbi:MAG: energy transducer TonB [Bacteroidetes bacterium CG12_big_fil_rev_8_21_14_0_65_60_17]|nr:MAG: energy transducer TonB [Bacteroidetes bacterium CG12_big_fil_rev_8_21_14_0_65_60_17]